MNKPVLSERMQAIEDMVLPGLPVADIGTDHGLIPADILLKGICPFAVLTDINPGPLEKCRENLRSFGVDPSLSKMVGGFGGGIQTGNACGAFLAAVSVLSLLCIDKKAHESGTLRNAVSLFVSEFEDKMGSNLCSQIRPRVFEPQRRCAVTVDTVCDVLEDVIERGRLAGNEE